MSSFSWPDHEHFQQMIAAFKDAFGDAIKGIPGVAPTHGLNDYDHQKEKDLDANVHAALLSKISASNITASRNLSTRAMNLHSVGVDALRFACGGRRSRRRDSFIIFSRDVTDSSGELVKERSAGQIIQIFRHSRYNGTSFKVEDFCVVKAYENLSKDHSKLDPYRKIACIDSRSYYNRLKDQVHILRPEEIISHFAAYVYTPAGLDQECMLAVSLDRVSDPQNRETTLTLTNMLVVRAKLLASVEVQFGLATLAFTQCISVWMRCVVV